MLSQNESELRKKTGHTVYFVFVSFVAIHMIITEEEKTNKCFGRERRVENRKIVEKAIDLKLTC